MNEPRSCCGSEENEDVSRSDVRDFYSKAAVSAQESLCCPIQYDSKDLSHIPKEVLEISYGCGSPVGRANLREGEVMVDLGSGGGIDCFIAARHVGKTGRVYGVDMTEEMLGVARKNATLVAENLGYNNIEFSRVTSNPFPSTIHQWTWSPPTASSTCPRAKTKYLGKSTGS